VVGNARVQAENIAWFGDFGDDRFAFARGSGEFRLAGAEDENTPRGCCPSINNIVDFG
jgi:hypothetical protein